MDLSHPELTVALALAVGIMAQSVSRLLRLPGIVLLLACGALLVPEGVGWIQPRALGQGLLGIVDFGVAIILFGARVVVTRGLKLTTHERVFTDAIAPRGIVAAAITAATLDTQSLEGARRCARWCSRRLPAPSCCPACSRIRSPGP